MSDDANALTSFAGHTSLEVGLGHMLINIADPTPGHEIEYARWYEDDHYFSAAMMAPFVFSGRRWVAPTQLRALQYSPTDSPFSAHGSGSAAATYWIAPGHLSDYLAWSAGAGPQLDAQGRSFSERTLAFVSFADHLGTAYRSAETPRDVFSLIDPPAGLVVQVIDVPDASARDAIAQVLVNSFLPQQLAARGSGAHTALVFQGAADTRSMRPALQSLQRSADNDGHRLLVLWLLDAAPDTVWNSMFASLPDSVKSAGLGSVSWLAPFLPATMGTLAHIERTAIPPTPHAVH